MILGIDTSNYTTSVCVVDMEKNIVFDERIVLDVKEGNRGLRQSEAVYGHVRNLPRITSLMGKCDINAVCASSRPRDVEGSFMPCFLVGDGFGRSLADVMNVPYFETTHQEGHIASALYGNDMDIRDEFIFVHMSGGTTEILVCRKREKGFECGIAGRTTDISAGQLVDRTGVLMGMKFPAGAEMDRLYDPENRNYTLPTSVKGPDMSFAGVETKISQLIRSDSIDAATAVSAVFRCVGRSIGRCVENIAKERNITNILIGGGVASSNNIRKLILREISRKRNVFYAKNALSSDNAAGVALIGYELYGGMNG